MRNYVKIKKVGKLWIYLLCGVVSVGILTLIIFYLFAGSKSGYKYVFNTIKMPKEFRLISSSFGNDGSEGSPSLIRKYSVTGTRETVTKELEPVLKNAGFNFTYEPINQVGAGGIGDDWFSASNRNDWILPSYLTIQLFPANPIPTLNGSDPHNVIPLERVNEVDLELSQ